MTETPTDVPVDEATGPTGEQLAEFHGIVTALLDDPEVTGDLLNIGVWLAWQTTVGGRGVRSGKTWIWHIAYDVYGPGKPAFVEGFGMRETTPSHHVWQVRRVLRDAAPRYAPFKAKPSDRQGG